MQASIEAYQLLSIRGRLKLESLGIKHSCGKAIRPMVARRLGLKPRDSYQKYIDRCNELLLEIQDASKKNDVAGGESC